MIFFNFILDQQHTAISIEVIEPQVLYFTTFFLKRWGCDPSTRTSQYIVVVSPLEPSPKVNALLPTCPMAILPKKSSHWKLLEAAR
jgi:hypothetical protein